MKNFEEILNDRLKIQVKTKGGAAATNELGEPLYPQEAMVMSVVSNAMKGDLASINFVNTLTKKSVDDPEYRKLQTIRVNKNITDITEQFKADGLYDPTMDFEIERLANTLLIVQRLEDRMQEPGHSDLNEETNRLGHTTAKLSLVDDIRQKQLKQFNEDLQMLRNSATARKQLRRRNGK